jgi:hypothetical protein
MKETRVKTARNRCEDFLPVSGRLTTRGLELRSHNSKR